MGIRFKDRLELFLLIGGKEFPFAPVNSLDFLHMSCSTRLSIPMIHFRVKDTANWMSKHQSLVDGEKIQVIIKADKKETSYNFRLNSFKELIESTGPSYEVDGYLDNVLWWFSSGANLLNGTSSAIIRKIGERCGIQKVVAAQTADQQVWIQKNLKYHEFAQSIAKHGYVDDRSCMRLGYDLDGTLSYKNIVALEEPTTTLVAAEFNQGTLIATDFKVTSHSGILNAVSGYADEAIATSVTTQDISRFESVPITKLSQRLMINSNIYDNIEKGRVLFAPLDGGNVHQNYVKAAYQNSRNANTYSFGVEIVTPNKSEAKLLDFINYVSKQSDEEEDTPYSGKYLITGRVIYVHGINYFEKFQAVRHGVNSSVDSQK